MEAERINQIGNTLQDLATRTADVIALRPSRVALGMSCITPCGL